MVLLGISGVTDRSIRNWAEDGGWEQRANEELFHLAPDLRTSAQATLALAAPEAAGVLRRVMEMEWVREVPVRVKGEVLLGDDGAPVMETIVDKDVLKMVVQSAQLILDRTGFSPVGTREIGGMDAPRAVITEADGTLRELSPEQLQQREEEAKRKYKLGSMAIGIGQGRKVV